MNKQTKSTVITVARQGVLTLLFGGAITWGIFYLFASLIVKQSISQSMFYLFATVAICIGCGISSIILALQRKTGGIFCGLICFAVFGGTLLIASLLCGEKNISSLTFLRLVLLCISACLGGYLGVAKAEKKMRRRRKHT